MQLLKKYSLYLLFLLFLISACKVPRPNGNSNIVTPDTLPKDTIPTSLEPDPFSKLVELETDYGVLKIELFFETPEHRENFLKLTKSKFYDSLLFHRVIKNFMMQGGDPTSKNAKAKQRLGANGPGYELDSEINSRYFHIKGALAAARQPDDVNLEKKSSGSQFYIVHGSNVTEEQLDKYERELGIVYSPEQRRLYKLMGGSPQLDMNYTIFGRVYEGFDVLDSIAAQMTDKYDRPENDIKMILREP